jgi:hypothetical protein
MYSAKAENESTRVNVFYKFYASISSTVSHNLRTRAEKMAQQHIHKLGEAKVGDTVKVQVPSVDRGHADMLHILAYILKVDTAHATYQLATKHGILDGWQSRNMFEICINYIHFS